MDLESLPLDSDPLPATHTLLDAISPASNLLSVAPLSTAQIVALALSLAALIVSGFVSGSEIAYFSLSKQQVDDLDESSTSKSIRRLLSQPERLLATILIANNLVNVAIVVLCTFALGPIFNQLSPIWSFILQSIMLTFLILLFGEILPKLYANSHTLQWARMASHGITGAVSLLYPISSMLVRSSSIVNRVVAKRPQNISADELSQALELTDVEARDDSRMLQDILKFGDTTAAEIMTPRVDITDIEISWDFQQVFDTVVSSGYSRLPVYEGTQDNIRGILYSRDLLPYIESRPDGFAWQSLLREPYYVPEARMIDDLLEDFRKRRIHLAVVVDEFGGTQGIVTMEDVLEEIVGDIDDEFDEEEKTYRRLPDDTYIFDGKTLLNDFFRITGQDEELYAAVTEECETLAGMLLAIKGDFPKEKEPLVYGRCRFLILEITNHRIASIRVKVMPDIQQQ